MHTRTLDDLADLADWSAISSGEAELRILADSAPAGAAMRLEFDFHGGGGFVVARRALPLALPPSFAIRLRVRAEGPANAFELKLVDPSGTNVWRYRDEAFDFRAGWRELCIPSRALPFAWGPAGGGPAREIGAIEIAVTAGPGGQGSLSIADLRLEDRTPAGPPLIRASGSLPGLDPGCVVDGRTDSHWCADRLPAWIEADFGQALDYSALVLGWQSDRARAFRVSASDDGLTWRPIYSAPDSAGTESCLYLPDGCSSRLRIDLEGGPGEEAPGLVALEVKPESFADSLPGFFHSIAGRSPRGRWPRWLHREQTWWTPVDVPDGTVPALFNEEGMVECARAGCSVEPLLCIDGEPLAWADFEIRQGLVEPPLPIPESVWTRGELRLSVAACATGAPGRVWLYLRYRLANLGPRDLRATLYGAIRPFQVSPPWQHWRDIGGLSPVRTLAYRDGAVWVNGAVALVPLSPPSGFGAAPFDRGNIADLVAAGALPAAQSVEDPFGCASGALAFDLTLPPWESREIWLAAPLGRPAADPRASLHPDQAGPAQLGAAIGQWSDALGEVELALPPPARDYLDTCRSALAHILIDRDGPALQPGPRRYTRSWIRDGAVMAAALLRLGRPEAAAAFVRWYAPYQAEDGNVPCCVDSEGPDWLPEHDSHGQLCFAVADYWRFTGDLDLVRELWPAVRRAVAHLERLRAERLTDAYRTGPLAARFGLLPESASHEGYLAHPVHSYWDDFWALRGLKDAAQLAQALGEEAEAGRLARLRDDFRATLHASIARTMAERATGYIPASVEWADQDPTALANALTLIDEGHHLPPEGLKTTFDLFLAQFRAMHGPNPRPWNNYSPYEVRIVAALVRLGRRAEAHEIARFQLAERRPPAWGQWPEIVWHEPRSPGHQGDLPHAWIGAEWCLAFRDFFAYERECDRSLVVGAGIPADWLAAGPISVRGLPTWYGPLDLDLSRRADGTLEARLGGGLRLPEGGVRLALPLPGPIEEARIGGFPSSDFTDSEVHLAAVPAEVEVRSAGSP
jgi:hypothetical protein